MSNQGDDCYYFFYSSCIRGDSCTFRHCEEAIGNETVCTLWEEGRCFRQVCKFRHMKIDKKRSEIPCYWETQPSGCQKANCAFHHTKERYVDGNLLPPSKTTTLKNVLEHSEDGVKTTRYSLSTLPKASMHLRGVLKMDNGTVPSLTHPPVVINASADDDDDDGGHVSIGKRSLNPVKSKTDRRGHLANAVHSGLCTDSAPLQDLPETEKNIRSVLRTVTISTSSGDEPCSQLTLAERLAKCRKTLTGEPTGEVNVGPPLNCSLAERLGRKIKLPERSENEVPRQKVHSLISIKERLGFPSDMSSEESSHSLISIKERLGFPSDMSSEESILPAQPLEEIRIKTLKEIKLEKLSQKSEQVPYRIVGSDPLTEDPNNTNQSDIRIKSFMEILAEKKFREMEEAKSQTTERRNNKQNAEVKPQNMPTHVKMRIADCEAQQVKASGKKRVVERVRVKTLEEIKREKALQQQKGVENAKKAIPVAEPVRGRRIRLGVKTNAVMEEKLQTEKSVPTVPQTTPGDVHQTYVDLCTIDPNSRVLVKSFEEIMREKRQRKQQEAAEQQLKEKTLQEPSPVDNESAKMNSHSASLTATKEPCLASSLLQETSQHSSLGKNKNLLRRKREASPSLKASQTLRVQDQQPPLLRSRKLSSPTKPLEPSSPVSPPQPCSLENPCQPSTPKKPQHLSLPARTQHPVLLPLRSQQLSSLVKPQQPTSSIKAQQSSLQGRPSQLASPLRFPHSSIKVCSPKPSAHHPSSPAKDQQSSFPITAPELSQQVVVQMQQPSKDQTQQLPQIVPNDSSDTETVQEKTDTFSTEEDSNMADKTGQATKKVKGKPKASVKPSIGKKQALPKVAQKRKGAKMDHVVVAAVKPLRPSTSTLSEPPAKKGSLAIVGSSSIEANQSPRTCLETSTESMASPEVQQTAPVPVADMGSPVSLRPAKIRRTSSSAPKTPLPAEDEFEKLMWELSGGRLEDEAEIDLDAGKDEDDLLLELSEMIGS